MEPAQSGVPPIPLLQRPHLLQDVWGPGDDWTGVTSTMERKRRQNRLNQRAYRRRKTAEKCSAQNLVNAVAPAVPVAANQLDEPERQHQGPNDRDHLHVSEYQTMPHEGSLLLTCPQQIARVRDFVRQAYENYSLGAPRPTNLQVLIRLNVLNAVARNAITMGFPVEGLCRDEFVSPFNEQGPRLPNRPLLLPSCPENLHPTALQRRIEHHPWIDLFPFHRFRDNMLQGLTAGIFDEDELCADLLGVEDDAT